MNAQLEIKFLTAGSYGGRGMKLSQGLWAVIAVVVAAGLGAYIWISGQGTAPKEAAAVEQVATAAPKAETAPVVDTEEAAPEPVVEEEPAAPEEPVVEEVQEAEAEVEAEPTPEVVETPVIRRPVIEVARVDPSGEVLLAGQGTAKAVIEALVDDAVAASGEIDGDENFVLFFDIEPSDQPRIISLRRVEDDEFIYSEQEVIVAPGQIKAPIAVAVAEEAPEPEPEPAAEAPVAAVEEIAEDVTVAAVEDAKTEETESVVSQEPVKQVAEATESDGDTVARISTQNVDEPTEESVETTQANVPAEVSETPAVGEAVEDAIEFAEAAPKNSIEDAADVEIAKAPEQPIQEEGVQKEETPTVMIADVSGVKIVSKAPASGENPEISLDAISYDEEGALTLAGRGVPSGLLRLYLNNAVIGETTTDALGAWSYDASALEPGVYTLRIDQLNADASKVLARMETPFKREARSKLQEQLSAAESPARINVVTVQPGNTLWGISRERYGQGILYVQVFEANRDKIRDPDLIYPGQIFNLPDDAAEEQ
ncbi:MAG: LysM peptidoglycan-binding domain-containing protein [Rhodobacteraceae bacterium]|jgi:nucleoid-associated protein YgaU|nr:LysM peptidoglycan-binding domain-containing protein [Paracoccaceae bacterium]NCV29457.1 LysM peptidoglycan-binding domain-containing protein [Paracoccaceae bacterium]NCW65167.1 LysM peptidoglycan-binding domain-containing protein [Paracoccaceae bacterium]NCX06978.1 LysM peptidoglycan-binding domain-containing protein [Paracoccaceae bacterium]NCX83582.1 LysM peptidoglycan-binding domain-containing protein [Paracoccaceae bacterium]